MKNNKIKRKYRQRVRCWQCGHEWKTKSRKTWITCHKCDRKFKRIENIVKNKNK